MELILYPALFTDSRKALLRTTKKWGHPYKYKPRGDLLERLSKQFGMTKEEVYRQLYKEREYLLNLM